MDLVPYVRRFVAQIYHAESAAQAIRTLSEFSSRFGFEGVAFVLMPRTGNLDGSIPEPLVTLGDVRAQDAMSVNTWSTYYHNYKLFMQDPVYLVCLHTALPFSWIFEADSIRVISSDARFTAVHLDGARKCVKWTGICGGITAPIRLSTGQFGYVSLITTDPNRVDDPDVAALKDQLLIIAYRFHDAVKKILPPTRQLDIPLSQREFDCLQLTAIGKSTQDTADLLGISYSTVRFHLQNAERKLGVATRSNAVAKAASLGLIRAGS